jgi:hypothetical protein
MVLFDLVERISHKKFHIQEVVYIIIWNENFKVCRVLGLLTVSFYSFQLSKKHTNNGLLYQNEIF